MRTLCESIRFWLRKGVKGKELDLLVVMALANLINYLISHKKLKFNLFSSQSKFVLINDIAFTVAWKYKTTFAASTIKIQTICRGWLVRDDLEDTNYCATQIQKVARGYLALANVFEGLYNIILVQSIWGGGNGNRTG